MTHCKKKQKKDDLIMVKLIYWLVFKMIWDLASEFIFLVM